MDTWRELWRNIEMVTGKKFSQEHLDNVVFTCSC